MSTKSHNQINEASSLIAQHTDLNQLHAKFFCHDMTFGDGAASLLSTNPDVPIFYLEQRKAPVYTDKTGRVLADGIYLSNYLLDNNPAYAELVRYYYKTFGFQNSLHIVKHENGRQHFYTFAFDCNQDLFQHLVINNIQHYKCYINHYHKTCFDLIERSSEASNQIQLPYSADANNTENTKFNFSKQLTSDSNAIDTFSSIYSDEIISCLSTQQIKCFEYLLQGMSARDIALEIGLSHRTVEHYISAIKVKLNCKNTKELIARFSNL